jgi:pimeloyl-ACP methyl ester carboxylesterase
MSGVYRSAAAAERAHGRYREYLAKWPVANEQLTLPTRQGETFVVASGPESAPPVVLLHGTMATTAMWIPEVTTLAAHFRVYAVDIIGDAGLSAPSRPSFASDAHALWLSDVLDALSVRTAFFVGMSLGGGLVLDFAVRRPERMRGLVLLCPGGLANRNILWWALPLLLLGSKGARKVRERIVGPAPAVLSEEARRFSDFSRSIFEGMRPRTDSPRPVTDEQLRRLTMPVLVLLGGKDVTIDTALAERRVHENVSGANVLVLPEARHYLGDQSQTIRDFLLGASAG